MYRIMNTGTEAIRTRAAITLKGVASDFAYSDLLIPMNSLFMNHSLNPRDEAGEGDAV
jgi:hypothetical protein